MKRFLAIGLVLVSSSAYAHFKLNAPASMTVQDQYGSPQKSAPCGLSDTSATADNSTKTNAVTTVQTGSMLQVKINETIYHPGHYRVAIAQTMAGLPADPPVTAGGGDPCDSTVINPNPTMPVLADGLLVHTSALSGEQTMNVQLPAGFTCTNCVVQVIQYMGNHGINNPGGCFYHHCATVTIADNVPTVDGPPLGGPDAAGGGGGGGGGGCSTTGGAASLAGLFFMALLVGTRRARSR
ncbi:MAG: lytic polysaccharide monooxygenase [Myxococcota bacterium]|nr:lytic polysaccharide monooxygenase [Deltaproteobacteria bacterium]MDQ3339286.1 lytic polysaccharide monooxygenase [Myxococcota bacterium]